MKKSKQSVAQILEAVYRTYHHPQYIHPDPLEFLHAVKEVREREIVGLLSSCLAYGRVALILTAVSKVLDKMDGSPYSFVRNTTLKTMKKTFSGFRHRFANGDQVAMLLYGAGRVIKEYDSLENCLAAGLETGKNNLQTGLSHLTSQLTRGRGNPGHLLPDPAKSSACKRLYLFLRWMVRSDTIDPGGWKSVSPAALLIPLDTHMHTIGRRLGFTQRKQADFRTTVEITEGFRRYCPEDPVRYDFSLSRLGIRSELDISLLPDCLNQR